MYLLPTVLIASSQAYTSTMTLATTTAAVTDSISGFVPDMGIFIAAAVVLGLVAYAAKRLVKVGR